MGLGVTLRGPLVHPSALKQDQLCLSFPTDVCLTAAASCRHKSKITKNEKENIGYVPYIVFLATYIRSRNINGDTQTGQSGHILF